MWWMLFFSFFFVWLRRKPHFSITDLKVCECICCVLYFNREKSPCFSALTVYKKPNAKKPNFTWKSSLFFRGASKKLFYLRPFSFVGSFIYKKWKSQKFAYTWQKVFPSLYKKVFLQCSGQNGICKKIFHSCMQKYLNIF